MYVHAHAPVRVEIAGGGTDLPAWTEHRDGLCLNLAIDVYCHAVLVDRPDGEVVAAYSKLERVGHATEIGNGLIRECALAHGFERGFEVHTLSGVTSRGSGLGASSSIAVALSAAFARGLRTKRDDVTDCPTAQEDAARAAWQAEIHRLRRPIGRQDHVAAAYGGLRLYRFGRASRAEQVTIERSFSYEDARWLSGHLALVPLGSGHDAGKILSSVVSMEQLAPSMGAVGIAVEAIERHDVSRFAMAINLVHEYKKRIPGTVTSEVAEHIKDVLAIPGVLACTVMGAGGGGHLLAVLNDFSVIDKINDAKAVRPDLYGARSEIWR